MKRNLQNLIAILKTVSYVMRVTDLKILPVANSQLHTGDNSMGSGKLFCLIPFIFCLSLFYSPLNAQQFPVQAITNITPPYSVYLSDYTSPGANKLGLTLLLTDISKFNYSVKLKLIIEGDGVTISTSPNYMPEPITLDGGAPLRLDGYDLASYFNPQNLDFKGYSKTKFLQTGALPEGVYRIGFQVIDYHLGIPVSLTGGTMAWLVLNDPPMINMPEKNTKLTATEPQSIMFQWMPRHIGSPNSAFNTEYVIQIYQIWPAGRNPDEVVRSTQPIIEKILSTTTYLYSNTQEVALDPGKQYAFRVQARDVEGRDLFRNHGYSEVQMFTYGDVCDIPSQIEAQATGTDGIKITWQPTTYNTAYYVQYREANKPGAEWFPKNTYINNVALDKLKPETTYEYQVKGLCGTINSDFSESHTIATQAKKRTDFVCGRSDSSLLKASKLPLTSLLPGDNITSGNFEIQVTKVKSGSNGKWSGEGFARIPFMDFVKIRVIFDDININDKSQVLSGQIVSVYNSDSKFVYKMDDPSKNQDVATTPTNPKNPADTTSAPQDPNIPAETLTATGDSTIVSPTQGVTTADNSGNETQSANDSIANAGSDASNNSKQDDVNNNSGSSEIANNTSIGNDHKNGDELQFGPFKIVFNSEPIKTESTIPNACGYKVESISFELSFEDKDIGLYKTNLTNASIEYAVDCTTGDLLNASIGWSSDDGLLISGIGPIDALIKNVNLSIDASGSVSGSLSFDATLNQETNLDQFVYVKEGVSGSFKFDFEATPGNLAGNFDMEGITNLNIDLRKDNSVLASLSDGTVDSEGNLTGDFSLGEPVSITQNNTTYEINQLDINATISLFGNSIVFNSIDGEGSIRDIPGTDAELKIRFNYNDKKIVATASSEDNTIFKFYGFTLGLESLKVEFSDKFDLQKIEGTNVSAAYSGSNDEGSIQGNITLSNFLIEDNSLKQISGSGSISYPPYAAIKLENCNYEKDKNELLFAASLDLAAGNSNLSASVDEVRVTRDGKITIGEVSVDLVASYGPVTVTFKKSPKNSDGITSTEATIKVKINDAQGINNEISVDANVDYKKTAAGITYIKANVTGLNIQFPDIYGFRNTINNVSFIYEKNNAVVNFEGKVNFTTSLTEDKQISSIVTLRNGLSGDFTFNFAKNNNVTTGSFDFSSIKNINIDLKKDGNVIASLLNGTLDSEGKLTSDFVLGQPITYEQGSFQIGLQKFTANTTVSIFSNSVVFNSLTADANIKNIPGIYSDLKVKIKKSDDKIIGTITPSDNTLIKFYGFSLGLDKLKVEFSDDLDLQKIEGTNVDATYTGSNDQGSIQGNITLSHFLIEDNSLKALTGSGNISYPPYGSIKLENCNYEQDKNDLLFSASLDLAASTSNLSASVDEVRVASDGKITIGEVSVDLVANYGPLMVTFKKSPQNSDGITNAAATVRIKINDTQGVNQEISFDANVDYKKTAAGFTYIKADVTGLNIQFPDVYGLKNTVTSLSFLYKKDAAGVSFDGKVNFTTLLTEDKQLSDILTLKKDIKGDFTFNFAKNNDVATGSFDYSSIKNINIDLKKGGKVIASLSNGVLDNTGKLTSDFALTQPITYTQGGMDIELKKFTANTTLSLVSNLFIFNSIDGDASVNKIPGSQGELNIKIKKDDKKIIATATSEGNETFKFYGFSLGLEQLTFEFSDQFDLQKIEGSNFTAAYAGENKDGKVTGDVKISHFLIENGALKDLSGSGSIVYPPYAKIDLADGKYNQDKATISFSASVNLENSNAKLSTTVKDINIASDGKITLGEINVDLVANYGPLTVEFKTAPSLNKEIATADAKITLKIADAGVNQKVTFDAKVDYKKTDAGFTYIKAEINASNLDFPEVYGIKSKITGASILYEKTNDNVNFNSKVRFSASLAEDKQLSPILILRKDLQGDFVFNLNYNNTGETSGSFDLSNLKGLQIDLIKDKKALATLTGSVDKDNVITGRFKVNEDVSFQGTGLTVTLNSLDLGVSYDLKKSAFKFTDGSGQATISNIAGVTGSLVAKLEYKNENLSAGIDIEKSKISICGMEISNMSLDVTIDPEFNFKSIQGEITAQHPKFNSAIKIQSFLIEDNTLKSFKINGNVEFAGFKFTISDATYKNEEFTCSAKVLLSDNFLSVDNFVIHKNGDVTVGSCKGSIHKSIMAIDFSAAFSASRFTGAFNATLSPKISLSGMVDVGTCSNCTDGSYPFGFYKLTVGAPIPIFAGLSISKLGGQFGYNCVIDYNGSDNPKITPTYKNYGAGFTCGIQDNAGMVELAMNPALFQWGNSTAQLDLRGTLKIPKDNPFINASVNVKLNLPSYNISGDIQVDVKIPASTGSIFKANSSGQFSVDDNARKININNISADFLNALVYNGSFSYTQNFSAGKLQGASGQLNGMLSYGIDKSFSASAGPASLTANFRFDFTAGLNTAFTDQGLSTASFKGRLTSNGYLNATLLGSSIINPKYSIDADATLEKRSANWALSAQCKFTVSVDGFGSFDYTDNFEKIF